MLALSKTNTKIMCVFRLIGQFTPVLALYDPFGVDVPLNFDITHCVRHCGLLMLYLCI